jgi:hypothetical protein
VVLVHKNLHEPHTQQHDGRELTDDAFLYHVKPINVESGWGLDKGYVGITTGKLIDGNCSRWEQHRKGLKHLLNGNLEHNEAKQKLTWEKLGCVDHYEFNVVVHGTLEHILKLEKFLRPHKSIGWNKSIGGAWNQQQGFNWLEKNVKPRVIRHTNNKTRMKIMLSVYDEITGKRVLCSIYAPSTWDVFTQNKYLMDFITYYITTTQK